MRCNMDRDTEILIAIVFSNVVYCHPRQYFLQHWSSTLRTAAVLGFQLAPWRSLLFVLSDRAVDGVQMWIHWATPKGWDHKPGAADNKWHLINNTDGWVEWGIFQAYCDSIVVPLKSAIIMQKLSEDFQWCGKWGRASRAIPDMTRRTTMDLWELSPSSNKQTHDKNFQCIGRHQAVSRSQSTTFICTPSFDEKNRSLEEMTMSTQTTIEKIEHSKRARPTDLKRCPREIVISIKLASQSNYLIDG